MPGGVSRVALSVVPTPYYPQLEERDCGATCLRMVLGHHGRDVPMARLLELSGTGAAGADLAGLAGAAEALGFEAVAAELTYDELLAPDLWPAILHWDGDHFVVLTEAKPDRAIVLDPAFGERRLTRASFEAHRVGAGRSRAGLIVVPTAGPPTADSLAPAEEAYVGRDPGPPPRDDVAESRPTIRAEADPAPRLRFAAAVALFAGLSAAGLTVLSRALTLAVDLQFREGWAAEAGALLTAAAAVLLGRYLALRGGLAVAAAEADRDLALLGAQDTRHAQDYRLAPDPSTSLRLLEDVDRLRVWRAYRFAPMWLAGVAIVLAVVFALAADVPLGLGLLAAVIATAMLQYASGNVSPRTQAAAVEAQVEEREAVHEYAAAAQELGRLGLRSTWLTDRLAARHARAAGAFREVGAEVVARRELTTAAAVVGAIALLSLGLYRLGFDGLQVGPLLFFAALVYLAFSQLATLAEAIRTRATTAPSRARLAELARLEVAPRRVALLLEPRVLYLTWTSPAGAVQRVSFPADASVGLTGGDADTRRALVAACLGRDNDRTAVLSLSAAPSDAIALQQLGRVAYVSPATPLLAGTVSSNVTLSARADLPRLRAVATQVGLVDASAPEGLETRIGFGGTGVDAGLRTRILLARALYHEADLVVVDGGTDGLTPFDEAFVIDTLAHASDTQLFLCNARRPQATTGLDYLIQIEEGEVEAAGTHEELLREGGAYALQLDLAEIAAR